jgi:hypothetical protein
MTMTMTTLMIQNDNDATMVGGGEGKVAEFIYSHKTAPQNVGLGMFNSLHTNALTFVGMLIALPGELAREEEDKAIFRSGGDKGGFRSK